MTAPITLTEDRAKEQGYRSMTTSYHLPNEGWMLENVLSDMRRGGVDHVLVTQDNGPEVWRKGAAK